MNREEINNKLEFMQELANRFPTKDDAVTEIINLNAILALPRGPEHFIVIYMGKPMLSLIF